MEVNVRLFGDLREGRFEQQKTQLEENSRVIDLINKHQLPLEKVAVCFVNNHSVEFGQPLQNGDTVAFSPPIGGM
ncbi:molybdopterin converting factor, small subunit [Desulfosporosinus orientis DSM 765]|uniref:Molybdopterin converting factor, small subunit n=1 Tax=Desulfosporosinus orientis (strain ATCC 19365 / DSM 765 / NCIMB 8382 / VKM B-1628 / Singapore I) TaxID=768706 RepID=G7WIE6_DESOD|nr:MoaD/ThiS family protein [Desulfosporosinus orientis]AET68594.1 molybdopterin converting factor, small subunit [Desulfosporosinus orientis DSM 765]